MSRNSWFWLSAVAVLLARGDDWVHLGGTDDRSRETAEVLGPPFSLDWSAPLPGGGVSSPAVADGYVVAGSRSGTVYAFRESGAAAWTAATGDEVIATPLLTRGRAYVPSTDRSTHIFALETGAEIGSLATGGTEMSSPVTNGSTVFLGLGFPNQHAAAYGAVNWQTPLEQLTYSSPALANGRVYLGCTSGRFYAIDAASGAIQWSFLTGASSALSSPLVNGSEVFLLTDKLYRVHDDPAQWGSNWTYTPVDPAPLFGGLSSTRRPCSSPVRAGNLVVFTMRFDQYHDTDADWILDTIVMREYLYAIDPATQSEAWVPVLLASKTVATPNEVPQLSLCPSPASFGTGFAAASSLQSGVGIYDLAGNLTETLATDAPTRASPTLANARLYVVTEATIYAFLCGTNLPPGTVPSASPEGNVNVLDSTPDITWTDPADDDSSFTYSLRWDTDGEILLTWNEGALPEIPADTQITYSIRARDPKGAYGEWSPLRQFWVNRNSVAPAPPTNLEAIPGDTTVTLTWTASASTDVAGYWLQVDAGPWTPLGLVTSTTVIGLVNGTSYAFRLVARDYDNFDSAIAQVTSAPMFPVTLNGVAMASLPAALAAAMPGDVIQLGVGTFTGGDLREGVTLAGWAPQLTTVTGGLRVIAGTGTAVVRRLAVKNAATGIDANGFALEARNVVLASNSVGLRSPAGSTVLVVHATIVSNDFEGLSIAPSTFAARNCILQANGTGIFAEPGATPALSYNNVVQNGDNYMGLTGPVGTYVLLGADHRDPDLAATVDAGDPADPFAEEPSPNGARANQGAFGNTPWAAKSAAPAPVSGTGDSGGGSCGLLGLEVLLLFLLRRRR